MAYGFLFTGDMHIRETVPPCRTDKFLKEQWRKLNFIAAYAKKHNLLWIDAGDVFHKAQPPLGFINNVLGTMHINGAKIHAGVYGNHDLPAHNINNANSSAWGTLYWGGIIGDILCDEPCRCSWSDSLDINVYGASYGEPIPTPKSIPYTMNVLVMHDMVYKSNNDIIPNTEGYLPTSILKSNPAYHLIVTGHNHQSFQAEMGQRMLVNVGCLTRQAADYADHSPRVFVWRPQTGGMWVDVPHNKDVVSREHIDKKEQKEEELNAFVETLQNVDDVSLSFEDNVEKVIQETQPEKPVVNKVKEAME